MTVYKTTTQRFNYINWYQISNVIEHIYDALTRFDFMDCTWDDQSNELSIKTLKYFANVVRWKELLLIFIWNERISNWLLLFIKDFVSNFSQFTWTQPLVYLFLVPNSPYMLWMVKIFMRQAMMPQVSSAL